VFVFVFIWIAVSLSSFVARLYCRVCGVCSAIWHVVQLFCLFDTSWGCCAGRVREQMSHLTSVLFRPRLRLQSLAVQASRHFPFRTYTVDLSYSVCSHSLYITDSEQP